MRKNCVRPFSNGTQFADWSARNCDQCQKYSEDIRKTCVIDYALGTAYLTDGMVTEDIAERMGYTDKSYTWDCPEKVGEKE